MANKHLIKLEVVTYGPITDIDRKLMELEILCFLKQKEIQVSTIKSALFKVKG